MSKSQKILLIAACLIIVLSCVMLFKNLIEYKAAKDEYDGLTQYAQSASSLSDVSLDDAAESLTEEVIEKKTEDDTENNTDEEEVKEYQFKRNYNRNDFPDIEVDFEGLKAINTQVVAWLYVGAVGINYPVVQNPSDEKNEYYLHHTLEHKENSSGCILMDWEVDPALTSWNTFIYGHNMKNGTMFGSLKKFINNNSLYEKDPYIYIFREEGIYRYKIYSYYLDSPDSKMYYTCDNLKEYRAYIRTALEMSAYDCNTPTSEEDNSVTLVTCSGSGAGKKRFFVHGTIIDRYLYPEKN